MDNKKKVTILVPAYNEQEVLPMLYDRIKKIMDDLMGYDFEILFVNDGSKVNNLKIIKEYQEKFKHFKRKLHLRYIIKYYNIWLKVKYKKIRGILDY